MSEWFETLFGFDEYDCDYAELQSKHIGRHIVAKDRKWPVGEFTTPTVADLRAMVHPHFVISETVGPTVHHIAVSDILPIHASHPGATIQAASQFNCLEFSNPRTTPESGITIYTYDNTQGPACALACAAGTFYRNYCVPFGMRDKGQTKDRQLNLLDELEMVIDNQTHQYWNIKNGYTEGRNITALNSHLANISPLMRDNYLSHIKVGVHTDTAVTFKDREYVPIDQDIRVTQVYCAAISCGYSNWDIDAWEPLAQLVLDAQYEATLLAAAGHYLQRKRLGDVQHSNKVFLTFIGGGVFQNKMEWIVKAIRRALRCISGVPLEVYICHFGRIQPHIVAAFNEP